MHCGPYRRPAPRSCTDRAVQPVLWLLRALCERKLIVVVITALGVAPATRLPDVYTASNILETQVRGGSFSLKPSRKRRWRSSKSAAVLTARG
jgi:hypothetical protein